MNKQHSKEFITPCINQCKYYYHLYFTYSSMQQSSMDLIIKISNTIYHKICTISSNKHIFTISPKSTYMHIHQNMFTSSYHINHTSTTIHTDTCDSSVTQCNMHVDPKLVIIFGKPIVQL